MESDPMKIAVEGIETFKKDKCDLIVVDTSAYCIIDDIRQVYEETKPDLVILVLDSSVAHAALDQARAFRQSAAHGAVILTKMDCHAKGCGALSAVAATNSPVIFLGTGEIMDEFEFFDVRSFVSHLLGFCFLIFNVWLLQLSMDNTHEFVSKLESLKNLSEEKCTLRIMQKQYQRVELLLAAASIFQRPPGSELLPKDRVKKRLARVRKYMRIMDFMTDKELDSTKRKPVNESRMMKIAQTSNLKLNEVVKMFKEYKRFSKIWNVMKGLQFHKKEDMRFLSQYMNALQEFMVIPPQMLRVSDDKRQKLQNQMVCSLAALAQEDE